MSVQSIIDSRVKLVDNVSELLTSNIPTVEKEILKTVLEEIKKLNFEGGRIKSDKAAEAFLLKLQKLVRVALDKSKYPDIVKNYITNFDKVEANINALQSEVSDTKVDWRKINPTQRIMITDITDKLIGSGVDANFTQPLRELMYKQVMFNSTYEQAADVITKFIQGDEGKLGYLNRYAGQVARDGINQYIGGIEQKIAIEIGANAILYTGSNLVCECGKAGCGSHCTRKQCKRWTKMKYILNENLQKEIDWAFKYGSGMMLGTTPANFIQNRGGWNCRHYAVGVWLDDDEIANLKNKV